MAYTSADLASVQAAIVALATGDRIASVSLGGKTIEYSPAGLAKLEILRSNIKAELAGSSTNCILIKTNKGL